MNCYRKYSPLFFYFEFLKPAIFVPAKKPALIKKKKGRDTYKTITKYYPKRLLQVKEGNPNLLVNKEKLLKLLFLLFLLFILFTLVKKVLREIL